MPLDAFLNLREHFDRFFEKTTIYTHKVVEAANFPEGPLKTNAGGECFAPCIRGDVSGRRGGGIET